MKCDLCGKKLHIEAWNMAGSTVYCCDNYKCPESPKFRKYLLGELEPIRNDYGPFMLGYYAGMMQGNDPGTLI